MKKEKNTKMKIRKENIISKKGGMSYLQILILIISTFAFANLIYSATEVSAQETELPELGSSCCEKTTSGNYCQFVQDSQCNDDFRNAPTQCEYVDYCKLGCCYSGETGWCNENTPERSCKESEGVWNRDAACNIAQCQRGCCVLGRNAIFTTPKNCQVKAKELELTPDFRADVRTELECIFLTEKDEQGACVYEEDFIKTCKFTTKEACRKIGGDFSKNVYCSDSSLGTDCKAHDSIRCEKNENGDGTSVYWFDSCGNREEAKENCSIFAGTICGQVSGENKCKSINCEVEIDGKKVTKKNGESWCVYDGTIGEGKDVAGSRHWKHICFMGEERLEPCEDYRNQICVQEDAENNGKIFSEAACRINNWRSCLEYNTQEESKDKTKLAEKCNENPDCFVKLVAAADMFKFNMCVPKYPPGFDLTNEGGGENAEVVCSMASQKCIVIYVKRITGWKCEINCECEKAGFAQKMNELCTSLGDCGAYVNIAGEVTDDGYSVKKSPKLNQKYLEKLKQYALPKAGQKAEPGNLSFLGKLGMPTEASIEEGGMGMAGMVGLGIMGVQLLPGVLGGGAGLAMGNALGTNILTIGKFPIQFGEALAAAGAALAVQNLLSAGFGVEASTSWIVAGAVFALLLFMQVPVKILGIIGIILGIAMFVLGIGKSKKVVVKFSCMPWQPPTGGENCEKCNGDIFKPCSPYRCKSLGQTCEFINQGTENELCVDNSPRDVSSPKISPLLGTITENYKYDNIKDNGFEVTDLDGNCIPEFTNVIFGIKTNKPAQCKISDDPLKSYDEMEDFFSGNLYLTTHTSVLNIPSPEAFKNQYNLTDAQIKALGEINIYVKCRSVNGATNEAAYTIKTCVKPGPDLTPPYITKTEPKNGAYVKYDATKQALSLWTNEPANCRWDVNNEKFDEMTNTMVCSTDIEDRESLAWPCNTTLTDLDKDTKFYIRCRDLSENNNTMQGYLYELKRSKSELIINEIKPANGEEVRAGTEPTTLELEAVTAGGAEDGTAECSFRFGETGSYIRFLETFSNEHKQVFNSIIGGAYKIYVKCEDTAGNTAENFTEFRVYVDRDAPKITRVFYNGNLKIMTNENSVCAYSLTDSKCKFELENATQGEKMTGEEIEHTAEWQTENTYYIKCKDSYGNEPGKCSIIARPYDII